MTAPTNTWPARSLRTVRMALDTTLQGTVALTHNGMALLGLGLAFVVAVLLARPDLRAGAEQHLLGWLLQRVGDETGCRFEAGTVTTPPGFRAAGGSFLFSLRLIPLRRVGNETYKHNPCLLHNNRM